MWVGARSVCGRVVGPLDGRASVILDPTGELGPRSVGGQVLQLDAGEARSRLHFLSKRLPLGSIEIIPGHVDMPDDFGSLIRPWRRVVFPVPATPVSPPAENFVAIFVDLCL